MDRIKTYMLANEALHSFEDDRPPWHISLCEEIHQLTKKNNLRERIYERPRPMSQTNNFTRLNRASSKILMCLKKRRLPHTSFTTTVSPTQQIKEKGHLIENLINQGHLMYFLQKF